MPGPFALLLPFLLAVAQETPSRQGSVHREIRVERVVLDAYVTGSDARPIPDLSAADFSLEVDGKKVAIESVDWIPADQPEAVLPPPERSPEAVEIRPSTVAAPGRLIVVFFQTDFTRRRLLGQMQMVNEFWRLLDNLLPTDQVAVLSFDSHLKLWQDFTADRERIRAAVSSTLTTGEPVSFCPGPEVSVSLARHLDVNESRDASSVERGLELTANALAPLLGAKSMLYFGWGLRVDRTPKEGTDYGRALRALLSSRVTLFTLDVSIADYHTLEIELMRIADLTGGRYEKTHVFPGQALDLMTRRISGRYVLVFVRPEGESGAHSVRLTLSQRKGEVLVRPYYED